MRYLPLLFICYLSISAVFSPLHAESLMLGGTGADLGTFKLLIKEFSKNHPHNDIKILPSMGSSGGIKALKHQKINIALTSRPLKSSEITAELQIIHYANTPLVFAVADTLVQQNVSKAQINQIYTGTLRQWPDGSPVRPILRPSQDSDSKVLISTMSEFKNSFIHANKRRGIPVALTDQDAADMITSVPGAIGTSTLALILSENRPLKALKFDGIAPTVENLVNKTYPIYKQLYLVYNENQKQPIVNAFIHFIYSETGQAILLNTGHLTIR